MAGEGDQQCKDIVLSYGREPEVIFFVKKLKQDLEARGFSVWLDIDDIISGSDWHGALGTALDKCKAIIPIITNKYINSNFCKGELYMANSDHKHVFPVFLEDVDLSANELTRGVKFIISGINWTMFRSGMEDYNVSLDKLMQGLSEKGLTGRRNSMEDSGNLSDKMGSLHLTPPAGRPADPSAPPLIPSSTSPYQMLPPTSYNVGFYPNPGITTPSPSPSQPPMSQGPSPNNPAYHVQNHTYQGGHSPFSPPQPGIPPGYPPSTAMPGYPPAGVNYPYPPAASNPIYPPGYPVLPSSTGYPPSAAPPTNPIYLPNTTPPTNPGYPPNTTPPTNPGYPPNNVPPTNPGYPPVLSNLPYSPPQLNAPPYAHPVPGYSPQQTPPRGYAYQNTPIPGEIHYPHSAHAPIHDPPPPYVLDPVDSTDSAPELPEKDKTVGSSFKVGMKLEAVDRRFPYFVCVATIMDRSDDDQRLQVHFDGWGPEYNYWCNHGDVELHPVGWCKKHEWELQTPRNQTWTDWESYLKDNHSEKAPENLFNDAQLASPGSLLFESGMKIEAIKKLHSSSLSVATIVDVRAGEVKVHFDGCNMNQDFWCSNYSTEIHPPMWCSKVLKTKAQSPPDYSGDFKWNVYLADPAHRPAPAHLFTEDQLSNSASASCFMKGMRLEAKDRLNPHLVAVATVDNVKDGKLLIHFDGWGVRYDYWCTPDCEDIHPVGWCQKSNRQLQPPQGQSVGEFSWSHYLKTGGFVAAPESLFTPAQIKGSPEVKPLKFKANMKLEAKDRKYPSLICVATVQEVNGEGLLLIHFDGWGPEYDYWCDASTSDIHPAGWCEKHSHGLQKPKGYSKSFVWDEYLSSSHSVAAPESLFTTVMSTPSPTLSFKAGMKLEAKDRKNPTMICVATINDVRGSNGHLLIHFDGWSDSFDYWCEPSTHDIHPTGWCDESNINLNAPRGYSGVFEWDRYLAESKSIAAPKSLFGQVRKGASPAAALPFQAGMKLEAKDRLNPSMVCAATITQVRNGELLVHFDGWSNSYDYWCDPSTSDIHPIRWCEKNGVNLHAPYGYSGVFKWNQYLKETKSVAAPENFFKGAMKFKKGMKLEAKDRLNPSMVCVATLTKVRKKEILIHFDGWSNKYDYWCDPTSNDIHPRDWCERNHHALTRPKDYSGHFDWDDYLEEEDSEAAPDALFTKEQCH